MSTRVVISSSAWRDYCFSTPLAALLWREVVGFDPLILLVENRAWWEHRPEPCRAAGQALAALDHFCFEVRFIGHIEGIEHAAIAQSARQHTACDGRLDPNDWLMMSDADLWPLDKSFYHQHGGVPIACYNSNLDSVYPTCHQTMQVKTWREIMGFTGAGNLNTELAATLKQIPADGLRRWCFDQDYSSGKIKASRYYPHQVQEIPRPDFLRRRIDRGAWPAKIDVTGIIDAHILKAPDERWPEVRPIIEQLLPHRLAWADEYAKNFRAGY